MKTTLTYEFAENEGDNLRTILDAEKWKSLVWQLDQDVLRRVVKYGDISEQKVTHYAEVRDELYRLLNDMGLEL